MQDIPIPPDKLHWEDIPVGHVMTYGAYAVTKDEIIEYAREYDPQPHHIDEEAAKLSLTKGLCASGWHSCAMFMRILCEGILEKSTSLGAAGIEEVKWLKPVRPGFVLKVRSSCVGKRLLKSRPGVGIWQWKHELMNQDDEVVMTVEGAQFLRVRNPGTAQ